MEEQRPNKLLDQVRDAILSWPGIPVRQAAKGYEVSRKLGSASRAENRQLRAGDEIIFWPKRHIRLRAVSENLGLWWNHDLLALARKLGEHDVSRKEPSP